MPYWAFNFSLTGYPLTFFIMLITSIITSTLVTGYRERERARTERDKEKLRSNLLRAISHDLRTPLTSFSLYTEMLEDGMVPEQKKPEYYANMQRECRRLEHLIENVLSYSRLQRNAIRRTRDTLTCQELFEPIAEKIDRRLREAGISFSFALAQPIRILPIHTDAVSVAVSYTHLTLPTN